MSEQSPQRGGRSSRKDWVLVDTLGQEPVVMAVGDQQKWTPLTAMLGRNPNAPILREAIDGLDSYSSAIVVVRGRLDQRLHIRPVSLPDGTVHGAQFWIGSSEEDPPPRPIAGAWWWDLNAAQSVESVESFRVSNPSAKDVVLTKDIAEDLRTLKFAPTELKSFAELINAEDGDTSSGLWTHQDETGLLYHVRWTAAYSRFRNTLGVVERHVRGLNTNVEQPNDASRGMHTMLVAQQVVIADREPGAYRGTADPNTRAVLRWHDAQPPWLKPGSPVYHPDDLQKVAGLFSDLVHGRSRRRVRCLGPESQWVHVEISAVLYVVSTSTNAVWLTFRLAEGAAER